MHRGMNVIALVKESERYIFLYDDSSPRVLLEQLGKKAADPDLNFTWYDAAILSQKVRRLQEEQQEKTFQPHFPKKLPGSTRQIF
ncbi:hypothetical protein Pla110_21600 [Polystyrenella longa]|uniref:Uncharacterized protein n=1 Tax=Polystyrenella longa TaxID=2528007 RepID=A0A518CMH3_9PLAN|nr:hypothetical protein [Polystyrenella longa]QDU80430.1 hypothetical protein Pla110_21600 [Polystyrenella longa]